MNDMSTRKNEIERQDFIRRAYHISEASGISPIIVVIMQHSSANNLFENISCQPSPYIQTHT